MYRWGKRGREGPCFFHLFSPREPRFRAQTQFIHSFDRVRERGTVAYRTLLLCYPGVVDALRTAPNMRGGEMEIQLPPSFFSYWEANGHLSWAQRAPSIPAGNAKRDGIFWLSFAVKYLINLFGRSFGRRQQQQQRQRVEFSVEYYIANTVAF